jgi:hypothetical protein
MACSCLNTPRVNANPSAAAAAAFGNNQDLVGAIEAGERGAAEVLADAALGAPEAPPG